MRGTANTAKEPGPDVNGRVLFRERTHRTTNCQALKEGSKVGFDFLALSIPFILSTHFSVCHSHSFSASSHLTSLQSLTDSLALSVPRMPAPLNPFTNPGFHYEYASSIHALLTRHRLFSSTGMRS